MKGYERGMRTSVIGWYLRIAVFALVTGILLFQRNAQAAVNPDGSVWLREDNFPDAVFREIVAEKFDKNRDGLLNREEIKSAKVLAVYDELKLVWHGKGTANSYLAKRDRCVGSFEGIEYLTELKDFSFWVDNDTEGFEASVADQYVEDYEEYLRVFGSDSWKNKKSYVKELDLSQNKKLEYVRIERKSCFEKIDISGLPKLKITILATDLSKLKKILVKGDTALRRLEIQSKSLKKIDLTTCSEMRSLTLKCPSMHKLNVSQNKKLRNLNVTDCGIQKLNLNHNLQLEMLQARRNGLVSLKIDNLKNLRWIMLGNNRLKHLVINGTKDIGISLRCQANPLRSITVKNDTFLHLLDCRKNKKKKINLFGEAKVIEKDKKTKIVQWY